MTDHNYMRDNRLAKIRRFWQLEADRTHYNFIYGANQVQAFCHWKLALKRLRYIRVVEAELAK